VDDVDGSRIPRDSPVPIAPSLVCDPALISQRPTGAVDARVVRTALIASAVGAAAAFLAQALTALIALLTNLSFFGRFSLQPASPSGHHLGVLVVLVPVAGALIVGVMARFGSSAIRGHGIPEAMENVLFKKSVISRRILFLKPISAAISIGTGGPFGAEGPIIATGGALGSVVGQYLEITADERKALLAAGAAAGMTATFGTPMAAVLLAIELLLFELRPRSLVPVALACVTAAGVRHALVGGAPVFPMPAVSDPSSGALVGYVAIGLLIGLASMLVTRLLYRIEDAFERLPIHWMWWPAIGAVVVGVVGVFAPHTLGVGYDNIQGTLDGRLAGKALAILCIAKLVSWSIALGSGTSGGTLAPLFTIGGALGGLLAAGLALLAPHWGVDPRLAALVGMAAMFAGASRALLASIVFAFECTREPATVLPLLAGASAAYLTSCLFMRTSIMTERLARRGGDVNNEYHADALERALAADWMSRPVKTLESSWTVDRARAWVLAEGGDHQGYPVLAADGGLLGVVTRRDLLEASPTLTLAARVRRAPVTVGSRASLREVSDLMALHDVGRVVVVDPGRAGPPLGMLTRSDLLRAQRKWLTERDRTETSLRLPTPAWMRRAS
jgi:H+/Cl- antiporter ClcA